MNVELFKSTFVHLTVLGTITIVHPQHLGQLPEWRQFASNSSNSLSPALAIIGFAHLLSRCCHLNSMIQWSKRTRWTTSTCNMWPIICAMPMFVAVCPLRWLMCHHCLSMCGLNYNRTNHVHCLVQTRDFCKKILFAHLFVCMFMLPDRPRRSSYPCPVLHLTWNGRQVTHLLIHAISLFIQHFDEHKCVCVREKCLRHFIISQFWAISVLVALELDTLRSRDDDHDEDDSSFGASS